MILEIEEHMMFGCEGAGADDIGDGRAADDIGDGRAADDIGDRRAADDIGDQEAADDIGDQEAADDGDGRAAENIGGEGAGDRGAHDGAGQRKPRRRRRKAQAANPKPKRRDQCKTKKLNELFDQLPGEAQDHYYSLRGRAAVTEFVNSVIERTKEGKLQLCKDVVNKTVMKRQEALRNKEKLHGYVLEEAATKCGSMFALETAIKDKRVIKAVMKGNDYYFFPSWQFERESLFKHAVESKKDKLSDSNEWQQQLKDQLGFEWEPSKLVPDMAGGALPQAACLSCFQALWMDHQHHHQQHQQHQEEIIPHKRSCRP